MRARRPPRPRSSPVALAARVALSVLASLAALGAWSVVAAPAAAAPAPPAALLLVLRAACPLTDPRLFTEHSLRSYAAAATITLPPLSFRVLNYNDTCGPNSSESITWNALASLGAGGMTVLVGRAPGATCAALGAAARALLRPQPAACAAAPARAAALLALAGRMRWRGARLPPDHTLPPDCRHAIAEIESALLAAGLYVHRAPRREDDARVHVSLVCDLKSSKEYEDIRSTVIIVQFEDSHRIVRQEDLFSTRSPNVVNATSDLDAYEKTFSSPSTYRIGSHHKSGGNVIPQVSASIVSIKENTFNLTQFQRQKHHSPITQDDDKNNMIYTPILYHISAFQYLHSLLLIDTNNNCEPNEAYEAAIDALRFYNENVKAVKNIFHMFESTLINGTPTWVRVTTFLTNSKESFNYSKGWDIDVLLEKKVDFDMWCDKHIVRPVDELYQFETILVRGSATASIVCMAGAATIALGAVGLTILATRRRLARHVRRRPRSAVILTAADFQFPADEQRRVGEGMETMLSWLQQLHDLSAPELDRPDKPDLLKRPTAPSAPSSTCSVTRLPPDGRIRYKGDPVQMKYFPTAALELKRKAIDVLLVMQSLRHENLNPFIGCLCEARPALVFEVCGRGSLEDVLVADDIRLDWTFRLSLLTDLVRGMRYLHASPLRVHGRLSSRNCVVDSRWVLRVTDYGLPAFARAQAAHLPPRSARELLWSAPELLRAGGDGPGTQAGDVFSFSIIMQEVIVRGEPYCMLSLTPEELVEKLCRPPPLIRPSVSMGAAPPEAVRVMRQCWSEQPDLRPDFNRLYDVFRHLHRGRKINIVDSMFEMLEKYSNNLEELIKERTEQLDMEKKKTEQLLNRMLPRTVAERLMLGLRVEPEEFEEVSIYFSDIVGFTAIAARSTPVQVVDLLNDLYTTFDAAIEQYQVYKVETIGDAYMVVGGLPLRSAQHAESVATMALHLLHLAGRFRMRHAPHTPLHLRIGLHTGPCCAAVVGLTMPRYCLFGDTVNTASRMESTGAAWRIQVSSATAERLAAAGGYRLRSRGLTQVKGKGAMHTYWLLGKDGFDKPLPTPPPLETEEVLFEAEGENETEAQEPPATTTQAVERQRSDPSSGGWQQSGATSADSSPPGAGHERARYRYLRASLSTVNGLPDTPRLADRRQWSLERGDALAAAAAELPTEAAPEPLALRSAPARPAPPRYRTRPDRPERFDALCPADTTASG